MSVELSIIILCYRSEDAIVGIAEGIERLAEQLTSDHEIILVGNYKEGSKDRTREIVENLAREHPRFKAICRPKKGMMGWDMRMGLEAASGDYLCVIDGDGQYPIESIRRCYEEIRTGGYALVKTYRVKRDDGWYRKCISRMYNRLFSVLFPHLGSRDVNSKPKMLTRWAYDRMDLRSDDWFIDAEIMLNIRRQRLPFLELPIEFHELSGRKSFVTARALFEFIRNLIVYRFRECRRSSHGC